MSNKVYVFLFDGYSDWEIGYALPEIKKSGRFSVEFFSLNKLSVQSMGGLNVHASRTLDDVHEQDAAMLPGGAAWEENKNRELRPLVRSFHQSAIPIAAICGATTLLAEMGLLNEIRHTSNAVSYLREFVPAYQGENFYDQHPAVTDQNIITANGTGPIEFATEIFKTLGLFDDATIKKWYQLFKEGIWVE